MPAQPRILGRDVERFIRAWERELEKLDNHIENLRASLSEVLTKRYELEMDFGNRRSADEVFPVIVRIFKENMDWMYPRDIRDQFQVKTGERLPESTLRFHLCSNENEVFERTGRTRSTRWRYIAQDYTEFSSAIQDKAAEDT